MVMATITSKGQVTLPKIIRDELHLKSGDRLEFIVLEKGDVLLRPVKRSVDEVFGRFHQADGKVVTTDEMDAAIRLRLRHHIRSTGCDIRFV